MKYYTILILLLSAMPVYGVNLSEKVYYYIQNNDYRAADSVLIEWRKIDGLNPELEIARFNRYINESHNTFLLLTDDTAPGREALIFADSLGNTVGSIQEGMQWNDSLYNQALIIISDAVDKYPTRLDMRFGYATALSMRDRTEDMIEVLKKTLSYGNEIGYKWLWQDNEPLEDSETEMIEGIWDFSRIIYNIDQDSLACELCAATLKYFPNDFRFINLCGAIKYFSGSYNEALNYFNQALAISPDDVLVMSNIAQVNYILGNYGETIIICDKIFSIPNADTEIVSFAEELKNKAYESRNNTD